MFQTEQVAKVVVVKEAAKEVAAETPAHGRSEVQKAQREAGVGSSSWHLHAAFRGWRRGGGRTGKLPQT